MSFQGGLSSLEDLATTKVAVEICNHPDVKKEIFCVPGSELDDIRDRVENTIKFQKKWCDVIGDRAQVIIEKAELPQQLQIKISNMILPIAFRMFYWKDYHVNKMGISCSTYLVELLNSSLFTSRGTVDKKRAAEIMVRDEKLDVTQRFKLACVYFLEGNESLVEGATANVRLYSDDLWEKIPKDKRDDLKSEEGQESLLSFWLDQYYNHEEYVIKDQSFWLKALRVAILDGSIVAVSYCLQKLEVQNRETVFIDVTMRVLDLFGELQVLVGWIDDIDSEILAVYIDYIYSSVIYDHALNGLLLEGHNAHGENFGLLNECNGIIIQQLRNHMKFVSEKLMLDC